MKFIIKLALLAGALLGTWIWGRSAGAGIERVNAEKVTQQLSRQLGEAEQRASESKQALIVFEQKLNEARGELGGYQQAARLFESKTDAKIEDFCFNMFQVTTAGEGLAHSCDGGKLIFVRGLPPLATDEDHYALKVYRDQVHQYTSKDGRFRTVPRYTIWRAPQS